MGYSSSSTQVMIGLGMSAISDSWYAFAQNNKSVEDYSKMVEEGILPVVKGHILNDEDLIIRKHILNLMCNLETSWQEEKMQLPEMPEIIDRLKELEKDGLLKLEKEGVKINEAGRPFIRNIAMAFDLKLLRSQPETRIFSMTI